MTTPDLKIVEHPNSWPSDVAIIELDWATVEVRLKNNHRNTVANTHFALQQAAKKVMEGE